MIYRTTIVIVGTNSFETRLLDGNRILPELFPKYTIKPESATNKLAYRFEDFEISISPNRISLEQIGSNILAKELEKIVQSVVSSLDIYRNHNVTAVGYNLNELIPQPENQSTGTKFCSELIDLNEIKQLITGDIQFGCIKAIFYREGLNCTLQLEPEFKSHGANLVLSLYIHQDIGIRESLAEKIHGTIGKIRPYMNDLSNRVHESFLGNSHG